MAKFLIGLVIILLIIAIAGAAVTARYYSEMYAAQEHPDCLGARVVETDCGSIEYARIGD